MNLKLKGSRAFALMAVSAAVTACGGGGSDGATPTEQPAPAPIPAPLPTIGSGADLVTEVASPTHAVGSLQKGAWDYLMQQRDACGFGLLNQEARLDTASQAHAHYLGQNSLENPGTSFVGHLEDAARPYFTGVLPWDRARAAGYADPVGEIVTNTSLRYTTDLGLALGTDEAQGRDGMRELVSTVYHLKGAMWGGRRGGVGAVTLTAPVLNTDMMQSHFRLVVLLSDEPDAAKQKFGYGVVATYPCEGVIDARQEFFPARESPNPFPDVTSAVEAYGPPIYFKGDIGTTVHLATATLVAAGGAAPLTLRVITKDTDPAGMLAVNEVFAVPTSALQADTAYEVTATGTIDGTAFTKAFTFRTR